MDFDIDPDPETVSSICILRTRHDLVTKEILNMALTLSNVTKFVTVGHNTQDSHVISMDEKLLCL
jgi:hypothetical protein